MDHLPRFRYNADERTRYSVRIDWEGEFSSRRTVETHKGNMTLEEAQRTYINRRDELGLGASKFGFGEIFDERGQHIARISYNGRLKEVQSEHFLAESPPLNRDRLYGSVRNLEDVVGASRLRETGIDTADVPEPVMDFLKAGVREIFWQDEMQPSTINKAIPRGGQSEVEVLICTPSALECLFDAPGGALGLHAVNTSQPELFGQEGAASDKLRIAIAWDEDHIRSLVSDNANSEMDRIANAEAWLVTLAHELLHVKLFVENGNYNTPADIDAMSDVIGHDLFDISSGYGIRSIQIESEKHMADDMEEAMQLMEDYCETEGRKITERVFGIQGAEQFLKAAGLDDYAPAPSA